MIPRWEEGGGLMGVVAVGWGGVAGSGHTLKVKLTGFAGTFIGGE